MPSHEESDIELLAQLRAGDHSAFEALFNRYRDKLYDYCYRLCQDPFASQDHVQDAFLRVFNSIDSLADPFSFRAWLFKIARNQIYNSLRKVSPSRIDAMGDIIDTNNPLEDLVSEESRRAITSVLDTLKPIYRELLILREYEELSYSEIASTLDIPLESVKIGIWRARKALARGFHNNFEGK
jgi:RNA polymerase sigma-70 factor (ECF subfamily)